MRMMYGSATNDPIAFITAPRSTLIPFSIPIPIPSAVLTLPA